MNADLLVELDFADLGDSAVRWDGEDDPPVYDDD